MDCEGYTLASWVPEQPLSVLSLNDAKESKDVYVFATPELSRLLGGPEIDAPCLLRTSRDGLVVEDE